MSPSFALPDPPPAPTTGMTFSVYLPASAGSKGKPVPVLYWLSGLECTDQNFAQKAPNAFKVASEVGVAIVLSDTSPRGAGCKDDKVSWDFGEGAGFYVDATEDAYKNNYRMYTYVTQELPKVVKAAVGDAINDKRAIAGHSMGGHGALTLYLRNPGMYTSCSAFAPIAHPSNCPWGQKALTGYLGANKSAWAIADATELVKTYAGDRAVPILIEQGGADKFLLNGQLLPEDFLDAAKGAGQTVDYRCRDGYDHGYFFIASFIEDHVRFHSKFLHE